MYKNHLLYLLFFCTTVLFAQERVTLSGTLTDDTGEKLFGVNVFVEELKIGTTTNEYGFYSLTLPKGTHEVSYSFLGFETQTIPLTLNANQRLNIRLKENAQTLQEVVVSSRKIATDIRKPEMSVNRLSAQEVKELPVVLGEADVIRALLTLPGVTNAGEGQSGFNVRGGGADQNLILLDEATIYNSSHLFGFFSVFNPDAVKDLKLYKGGIPARYGGRLSSVLDIYQREGNQSRFGLTGGIGLISSRLLAEGPIVQDRGSFLVAGRSSYAHLFLKLTDNDNSAYFYDLNTKLSYKLTERDNLYLSGYFGRDVFSISDSFVNTYGNAVLNLRWNRIWDNKLFSNLSLIYSDYYYGLTLDFVGFKWDSGIRNYNLRYDFKHYLSETFRMTYGVNAIYHTFNPGSIRPNRPDSGINPDQLDQKYALEPAIYWDAEQQLSERFNIQFGLRASAFYRYGPQPLNTYENNQAVIFNSDFQIYEKADPTGTIDYGRGDLMARFGKLEPRLALAYTLNDQTSIKASYNRMAQYLHLISNTQSPTPLDVWAPSGPYLKPQSLDQWALGYFRNFNDDNYSLEAETFYKTIDNRVDFIDGADLIANNAIEQVLLNGRARAYGVELLLRKNAGRLSGWIGYTLARTEQQTPGRTPQETGINNGQWYRTGFDKLHDLSITAQFKHNDRWRYGANFALQSGQPVTFPNGSYDYMGISVPTYGQRNADRLPAYHHLDLSATYTPKQKAEKRWQGEWVFSAYNVYDRRNAAAISFRQNATTGANEALRLSIFGIVPAITYNFKY